MIEVAMATTSTWLSGLPLTPDGCGHTSPLRLAGCGLTTAPRLRERAARAIIQHSREAHQEREGRGLICQDGREKVLSRVSAEERN
jgi:hypothetical protein